MEWEKGEWMRFFYREKKGHVGGVDGPMRGRSREKNKKGWGTPSFLSMFPIMLSACLGIKPWRCPKASLLALSRSLLTYVGWLKRKMSRTRRSLGCLYSVVNVNGEEAVGRRVRSERTHVERVAFRMRERRQETWRPLN